MESQEARITHLPAQKQCSVQTERDSCVIVGSAARLPHCLIAAGALGCGLMAHTYEELRKKTVAELRDIAKDIHHDAVQGFSQMNKEHLLPALCKALGIDAHEHHVAALAEKSRIKATMRALKIDRAKALSAGEVDKAAALRRHYHHLNHTLRTSAKRAVS
jgi:hypothetical protein